VNLNNDLRKLNSHAMSPTLLVYVPVLLTAAVKHCNLLFFRSLLQLMRCVLTADA